MSDRDDLRERVALEVLHTMSRGGHPPNSGVLAFAVADAVLAVLPSGDGPLREGLQTLIEKESVHEGWCHRVTHGDCCRGECDCNVSQFRALLDDTETRRG